MDDGAFEAQLEGHCALRAEMRGEGGDEPVWVAQRDLAQPVVPGAGVEQGDIGPDLPNVPQILVSEPDAVAFNVVACFKLRFESVDAGVHLPDQSIHRVFSQVLDG